MKTAADHFVHGEQSSRETEAHPSHQSTIFAAGIAICGQCECEEKDQPCEPDEIVRLAGV